MWYRVPNDEVKVLVLGGGEWGSGGEDARPWEIYGTGNKDRRIRLGRRARFGDGGGKTTPSVGDVLAYREEYRGRSEGRGLRGGYQNGGSDIFWDVHIFYVRNGGLKLDLCGMAQANIGLIVLQKKKSLGVVYSGVGGLQGGGVRHTKPTLRRCGNLLLEVYAICVW